MNRQDRSEVCENVEISSTAYSDCPDHSYGIQESTSMEEKIDHSYVTHMETDFDSTSVDDKRKVLQEIEMVKCENFIEYDDITSSELDPNDTFLSGVSQTYASEGQQCLIVKEEIDLDQIKEEVSTDCLESELPQDDNEVTCTDTVANIMFSESTHQMPISTVSSSNGISSEVVSGFRENSQLYHIGDGYFYHTIRVRGNRRYLRCAIRSCQVRAIMTLDKNAPIVISPDRPFHNHEPEYLRLRKTHFLHRIKHRAEVESTKISKIYKEEVARDPEIATLISEETVKQRMGRNRRNNRKFLTASELEEHLNCNSNKLNKNRKQTVNLTNEELLLDCPDSKQLQVTTPSEVVSGFRDNFTLYHVGDGYFYYTMQKRKHKRYLKCTVKNCRVRASMALYKNAPIKISPHSPLHSHQPDLLHLRKMLFIQRAKHRAEVEDTKISEIYKEETARDFEAALLISEDCVKKRMMRSRKRRESMKSLHKHQDGLNVKPRRMMPLMRDNGVTFYDKDGYFYRQNKINALHSIRYLKCSIRSCKARASMRLNKKNAPVVISPSRPYHSHLPDILRLRKIVFIQKIKQRAKEEKTPISVIYREERARDYEASAQISEMCAKQRMQRIRRNLRLKPRVVSTNSKPSSYEEDSLNNDILCEEVDMVSTDEADIPEVEHFMEDCTSNQFNVINKVDEDSIPENNETDEEEDPQNFLSVEDNSNTSLDQQELGTVEVSYQGTLECNPLSLPDETDVSGVFEERPAQKVQGFRDNTVLYHDGFGYFYVSNRGVDNVVYLQCSVKNCRVRASVGTEENSSIKLSTTSPLHNHQPDFVRLRLTSFMKNATKRALSDLSTIISVIYNEEAERDPEGASCISAECAKQRMSRARKKYLQTVEPRLEKSSKKKNSPDSRLLVSLNDDKSSDNSTKENTSVLQNPRKRDAADDSSKEEPMILENQNEKSLQKEIDSSFIEEKVSCNNSSTTNCDKNLNSEQKSKCQLRRKSSFQSDDIISENNLLQEKPSIKVPGYRVNTELYHDGSGFFYCSNRTRGSLVYLQCRERTCRVRASVHIEENSPIKLSATSPMHNHEPDFVRLRLKAFMEKARQRVLNEDLSVNTIYKEEAKKNPEGAATISAECAKQRLSRAWKKHLSISVPERLEKNSLQNQADIDARRNENCHKSITQSDTEDSQSELPSGSVGVEENDSTMLKELASQKVPGFRKNSTLYHDGSGYFFTCNKTRGNISYLHCCLKTCCVRATVGVEENSPIKLSTTSPFHNHQPDFVRLHHTAFMKRIRDRTINEETPINDIYREEAKKDPKGAATIAEVCVKQRLSRLRKGLSRSTEVNSTNPSNEEDLFNSYTSHDIVFSDLSLIKTATTNDQSVEDNNSDLTSRSENVESKTIEEKPSEKVVGFRKNTAVYHDGSGYFYCSNRTRGSISYLQCCIKTCHVRASVGVEENSPIKLSATSPLHNHEPDFARLHRTAFMDRANHRAISEDTPINVIYTEEAEKDPEGAASISVSCAKQRMSRARQRHLRIWEYFEPV